MKREMGGEEGMNNRDARPNWWILYLILPLAVIIFGLEVRAPLSEPGHRAAEVGILLLIFALVEMWFMANRQALLMEERQKYRSELLHASAPKRLRVETMPWTSPNGNGRVRPRGLARHFLAWLLAAYTAVSMLFR
jgi:hypothetical protein